MTAGGLIGLEDAGFLWEGEQVVYTDAFQVRHYVAGRQEVLHMMKLTGSLPLIGGNPLWLLVVYYILMVKCGYSSSWNGGQRNWKG